MWYLLQLLMGFFWKEACKIFWWVLAWYSWSFFLSIYRISHVLTSEVHLSDSDFQWKLFVILYELFVFFIFFFLDQQKSSGLEDYKKFSRKNIRCTDTFGSPLVITESTYSLERSSCSIGFKSDDGDGQLIIFISPFEVGHSVDVRDVRWESLTSPKNKKFGLFITYKGKGKPDLRPGRILAPNRCPECLRVDSSSFCQRCHPTDSESQDIKLRIIKWPSPKFLCLLNCYLTCSPSNILSRHHFFGFIWSLVWPKITRVQSFIVQFFLRSNAHFQQAFFFSWRFSKDRLDFIFLLLNALKRSFIKARRVEFSGDTLFFHFGSSAQMACLYLDIGIYCRHCFWLDYFIHSHLAILLLCFFVGLYFLPHPNAWATSRVDVPSLSDMVMESNFIKW